MYIKIEINNEDIPLGKKYISPLNISALAKITPRITQKIGFIKKDVKKSKYLFSL